MTYNQHVQVAGMESTTLTINPKFSRQLWTGVVREDGFNR